MDFACLFPNSRQTMIASHVCTGLVPTSVLYIFFDILIHGFLLLPSSYLVHAVGMTLKPPPRALVRDWKNNVMLGFSFLVLLIHKLPTSCDASGRVQGQQETERKAAQDCNGCLAFLACCGCESPTVALHTQPLAGSGHSQDFCISGGRPRASSEGKLHDHVF